MRIVEQTKTRLIIQQDPDMRAAMTIGCFYVGLGSFLLFFGIVVGMYAGGAALSLLLLCPILGFVSIAYGFLAAAEKTGSVSCYFNKPLDRTLLKVEGLQTKAIQRPVRQISKVVVTKHTRKLFISKFKYFPGKLKPSTYYSISLVMASGERIPLTVNKLDANSSSFLAKGIAEFLQIPLSKAV